MSAALSLRRAGRPPFSHTSTHLWRALSAVELLPDKRLKFFGCTSKGPVSQSYMDNRSSSSERHDEWISRKKKNFVETVCITFSFAVFDFPGRAFVRV